METTDRETLNKNQKLELLSKLFGSYKAEWLHDSLFELYSEPSYVPELTTARPCVLNGGRGTGKTTVLRSLSYTGQAEILKRREPDLKADELADRIRKTSYYGFYYRANTTRLSAFQGASLNAREWQTLFHHYINLLFGIQAVKFLVWYKENANAQFEISRQNICDLGTYLSVNGCQNLDDLSKSLNNALVDIESYINNIGIDSRPRFSTAGALDNIFTLLAAIPEFAGKMFFLIIDEYENFNDQQQQVINTLIKHTNSSYTFKIGVKKLGWRVRSTLNENESLISPADYVLIDISEKLEESEFVKFAEEICNSRISKLLEHEDQPSDKTVRDLFCGLSSDEEADLLGVTEFAKQLRKLVDEQADKKLQAFADSLKDLDLYVVKYLAGDASDDFLGGLRELMNNHAPTYRLDEYRYASLFTLKSKRPGIKKYYCGWDVFCKLSAVNIRYVLELVEQTLLLHLKEHGDIKQPISPETQTLAAQAVGKRNLQELDGLSTYGAKLTKLVLGLGRIFGTLAEDSGGHANEVNQFRIRAAKLKMELGSEDWLTNTETASSKILRAAVMHLAVIPFPGNKPKDEGETRENTFQLHPIFAPYFIFSYRKRRNLMMDEEDVLGLIETPKQTIRRILAANNRMLSDDLPEQLKLFSSYYD